MKSENLRILVVDDEVELAKAIQMNLEFEDFKVDIAFGGTEAFEMIEKNHYDFILSDIRMPQGDGVDLLNNVRKKFPEKPIVFMYSGQIDQEGTTKPEDLLKLGANEFLTKPIDIDQVIQTIKNLFEIEG